jgi:hypothetical protein
MESKIFSLWFRFAGHAVRLAGAKFVEEEIMFGKDLDYVYFDASVDTRILLGSAPRVAIGRRATNVLGLTDEQASRLFYQHNTLNDLEIIVSKLIN